MWIMGHPHFPGWSSNTNHLPLEAKWGGGPGRRECLGDEGLEAFSLRLMGVSLGWGAGHKRRAARWHGWKSRALGMVA